MTRVRFSQVVALAVRLLRQQTKAPVKDCADACGLSPSGYSRVETGETEVTVEHLWLLAPRIHAQPRTVLRMAEGWMTKLEAQGWTEDRRAPRCDMAVLTSALAVGAGENLEPELAESASSD